MTRFNGNLTAPSTACGQGVLIVTGDFTGGNNFEWEGILLVGYLVYTTNNYEVDGLVVSGLDGNGTATGLDDGTSLTWERCNAFKAGKRLSHFESVGGTWWEGM